MGDVVNGSFRGRAPRAAGGDQPPAVVDVDFQRHLVKGKARCIDCAHEWDAVTRHVDEWIDCPACKLNRGRILGTFVPEGLVVVCDCGGDLFHQTAAGLFCPLCGHLDHRFAFDASFTPDPAA